MLRVVALRTVMRFGMGITTHLSNTMRIVSKHWLMLLIALEKLSRKELEMSEERRCCICQRIAYQDDAHAGYDCANWPEQAIGQNEMKYRSFNVSRVYICWEWVHEDYDGPEDNRAGTERNLVDCFRAIDDWHEDNA